MGKRNNRIRFKRGGVRRRLLIERLGDRRVLAAITGTVFGDNNHSYQQEDSELGAVQRLVFIDSNQDAGLSPGEPHVLSQVDGSFAFEGLDDGTYFVRLFDGVQSQVQTYPIEATVVAQPVAIANASQLSVDGDTILALTSDSLFVGSFSSGTGQLVAIGDQLTKLHPLPDGTYLVFGTDDSGNTVWRVAPDASSVTPVALTSSDPPIEWSGAAIDGTGRGVLIEQSTGDLYSFAYEGLPSQATLTTYDVAAGSQAIASDTGMLSVIAEPSDAGMVLRLWSNETNSYLQQPPVTVSGLTSMLAYDDVAGVLVARNDTGGVEIYDTADSFKWLHSLDEFDGPVAIDGERDLLMAISPGEAMLKIMNLRDGQLLADLAIDLSQIGEVAAMALGDQDDSIVVLGAAGVVEIALQKTTAAEIAIVGEQASDPLLFGIAVDGENAAPSYTDLPVFEAIEDALLELPAPAALFGAFDLDADTFVLLQTGQANHGDASIGIDGSVRYQPEPNFFGTDTVAVRLHDGRDLSEELFLQFNVAGVPDHPTDIVVDANSIPENIPAGFSIANIEVTDADGGNHLIEFNDQRFVHNGGEIIFRGDSVGGIDYESEALIPLTISVTDPETGTTIEEDFLFTVTDRNDPVTAITPTTGFVDENQKGAIVAELDVHDQDAEQAHFVTVDDDRFVVANGVLRLAPGIEVDYESEPTIVINITAKELPGGATHTEKFTVTVRDEPEQPQRLDLTNHTVIELVRGEAVGNITVDGQPATANFEFTVDDPRFEVEGSELKLKDDEYLVRFDHEEVLVEVSATDTNGIFTPLSEEFVVEVLVNALPFHNEENPYDVDSVGGTTAGDALIIINYMGDYGPGPVGDGDPGMGYDVNGDGEVTALDALLVINQLNRINAGTVGGSDGEGEEQPVDDRRRLVRETNSDPDPVPEGEPVPTEADLGKIVDASVSDPVQQRLTQLDPVDDRLAADFADRVDFTLSLLSDEEAS